MHELWELRQKQGLPLEAKIIMTQRRLLDWYNHFGGNVYISFSGGKDSTVLLDIARPLLPNIEAVFADTGLEYPEIREFVKTFDNVTILRPKLTFNKVIEKYGYPMISKEVAELIYNARLGYQSALRSLKGLNGDGTISKYKQAFIRYAALLELPIKFSASCCKVMKKEPFKEVEKTKKPITAVMAAESKMRENSWRKNGCNAFDAKKQVSNPMSFWLEQDVLQYIKRSNIKTASVYGTLQETNEVGLQMLEGCGKCLRFSDCQRTGCVFCGFGAHLDTKRGGESRFVKLRRTHPRHYDYCMGGGEFDEQGFWKPNNQGLGMKFVIDELNKLFSKTLKNGKVKKFIEY